MKKDLTLAQESHRSDLQQLQKELELLRQQQPQTDKMLVQLKEAVHEKELEIKTLKANQVNMEMKVKLAED